jgi:hypothetical protein
VSLKEVAELTKALNRVILTKTLLVLHKAFIFKAEYLAFHVTKNYQHTHEGSAVECRLFVINWNG